MSNKLFYDYMKNMSGMRRQVHEDVHELERDYSENAWKGWSRKKTLKHYARIHILDKLFNKHLQAAEEAKYNNDWDGYYRHLDRFLSERPECRIRPTK